VGFRSWLELLGASLSNFIGLNLLTLSNQLGLPATVALLVYIQVFYNYLADLLFFEVNFQFLQYLGMFITMGFSLSAAAIRL
jgi:hypothetical protein